MKKIVLASKSPRRKLLLSSIVDTFEIDVSNKEETYPSSLHLEKVPAYLARQKVNDVYKRHQDALVIGADTVVIINNQILGKPKDKDDAYRMISMLQGKTHKVVTGIYLKEKGFRKTISAISYVTFKKMTEDEINNYCLLDSIYDKAGAYAIQEDAKDLIIKIKGSYNNIVGLPIELIKDYLK